MIDDPMRGTFEALLLDFDGTMVDSSHAWIGALDAVCQKVTLPPPQRSLVASKLGHSLDDFLTHLVIRPAKGDVMLEVVKPLFSNLLDELLTETPPLPGCRELLALVQERLPVAVVSGSSRHTIAAYLEAQRLAQYVQIVTGVEDYQRGKPDPQPWLITCDALGIEAKRALAVEDSTVGVASARAAGCSTIGVLAGNPPGTFDLGKSDCVVESLTEVCAILRHSL